MYYLFVKKLTVSNIFKTLLRTNLIEFLIRKFFILKATPGCLGDEVKLNYYLFNLNYQLNL
jgi:hypothetical protein